MGESDSVWKSFLPWLYGVSQEERGWRVEEVADHARFHTHTHTPVGAGERGWGGEREETLGAQTRKPPEPLIIQQSVELGGTRARL